MTEMLKDERGGSEIISHYEWRERGYTTERRGGLGRARRSRSGPARPELSPTFPTFVCEITQRMMNGGGDGDGDGDGWQNGRERGEGAAERRRRSDERGEQGLSWCYSVMISRV